MTKDVMVTISGFHMNEEEGDTIEMVHIGEYYERNGTHYILYEERLEGIAEPVKNRIKVREQRIELQKRGPVTVNMVFEKDKRQSSTYAPAWRSAPGRTGWKRRLPMNRMSTVCGAPAVMYGCWCSPEILSGCRMRTGEGRN